ncbi:MAG: hypothetical protein KJT03_22180, partial [Verrucomicrobiae bacterium]|nr:hypothetical protein [Verrucomicrobiae bacterium]
FLFTVAILSLSCALSGANRIVIKAVASEDYVKERALDKSKKIQTYQFMKGRYFAGLSKNPGMEKITFNDIVQDMAKSLVKQNYYPNPVLGEGDLLIVVHYGVTDFEESLEDLMGWTSLEDMGYNDTIANAGGGGTALDGATLDAINNFSFNLNSAGAVNSANDQSQYFKAQLLGMESAFSDRLPIQEEYDLKHMLQEERYFVVLMAYDYPSVKSGQPKLLWSTRYSIRAVGQSFADAIQDMNLVAGDYYGKNLKGLTKKRVTDDSRVEMGEIEVIDSEEPDPDSVN